MATVTAREANQHFSKFLDAASRGEEVTITRRGKPVAKLVPVQSHEEEAATLEETERQAALGRLARGYPGKSCDSWTRDELYDDRIERPWQPDDTCD
jgi:prevent-host-death family protein